MSNRKSNIKEFHLFAGIGGGIYGGKLLGHTCCAGVEIDENCQAVLKQRQHRHEGDPGHALLVCFYEGHGLPGNPDPACQLILRYVQPRPDGGQLVCQLPDEAFTACFHMR